MCQSKGGNGSSESSLISCEIADTCGFILNIVFEGRRRSVWRDNGKKLILRLFKWFQGNESPKTRPAHFSEDAAEVGTVHGDTFSSTVAKSNSLHYCVPETFGHPGKVTKSWRQVVQCWVTKQMAGCSTRTRWDSDVHTHARAHTHAHADTHKAQEKHSFY